MFNSKSVVILAACLLTGLSGNASPADRGGARFRTKQLIIQFRDSETRRIQSISRDQSLPGVALPDGRNLKFLRRFGSNGVVARLPEDVTLNDAQRIADELAKQPGIAAVQPDKRYFPALVPNDPAYPPGANAIQDPGQWHLFEDTAGINMPGAWDQSTGSAAVVVAVVDTGIVPHRDLDAARVLPGYDFFSDVTLDNDGMPGRDNDPADPGDATSAGECGAGEPAEDSSWHGLSVAGVIAAQSDNNMDIAGMDFQARLLPIRALGKCGGLLSDVADAVRWAAGVPVAGAPLNANPASVINLSLGGSGACTSQEQDAINAAVARGAVVVVAAGNEGGSIQNVSPANCKNVIVAGAIARDGRIASYVSTGVNVDVTAPGGDNPNPPDPLDPPNGVLTLSNFGTTTPAGDALAIVQGTSFTAAQVSAVASLMRAVDATLSPAMVENVIKATTRAFPDASCNTSLCGTGVLDASAALAGAADPSAVVVNNSSGSGGGGGGCVMNDGDAPRADIWLLLAAAGVWRVRRSSRRAGMP
jgi:serine protease